MTVPPDWIPTAVTKLVLTPVSDVPAPSKVVALTVPVAIIPLRAVITPIASMFVTSSYVSVPPMVTLPLKVASANVRPVPTTFLTVMSSLLVRVT